ncbi:DUF2092 domain-containing protein [Azospirillum sp. sgz301742]
MKSLRWLAWPALCITLTLGPALAADPPANPSATPPQAAGQEAQDDLSIDAAARDTLNRMAETLAKARGFSVTIRSTYDVVQDDGQKIEFGERRTVTLSRPDALRVDSQESDGKVTQVTFDGQAITVFNPKENVYARVDKTGNVDDAVRHLVQDLQMRLPLALLLVSTLPAELDARLQALDYVERDGLTPVPSDHLAGQTEDIDFQVWVAASDPPLPQRIIITYKNDEGEPQYRADFSDWQLNPDVPAAQLAFRPPDGAERIPFLVRVPRTASGQTPNDTSQGTSGASGSTEGAPK